MSRKEYLVFLVLVFLNVGTLMVNVTRITLAYGINSSVVINLLFPVIAVMFLIFALEIRRIDLEHNANMANMKINREGNRAFIDQQNLNMALIEQIDRLNEELDQRLKKDQKDEPKQKKDWIKKRSVINAMKEIEV